MGQNFNTYLESFESTRWSEELHRACAHVSIQLPLGWGHAWFSLAAGRLPDFSYVLDTLFSAKWQCLLVAEL